MDDLLLRGIADLAAGFRARRFASAAVVESCLDRIERLNPALNCFTSVDIEGARQAARESDARFAAGQARSMLEGVPISIKDNLLAKGMPATWGSRALAAYIPQHDELPVARLRAAGAIILGKTNVPELTLEGYTANALFGVTRNPWNTALTPGGSSGGAAASVAARLVPAAIGTDGGGSIRRPACHTGLVGFKPSPGRVPRLDGFPAILTDFETIGTLTRSVADLLLMDALAGPEARDRKSLITVAPTFAGPHRRILYVPRFGDSPVDPEVAAATDEVARFLSEAGHFVRPAEIFFDLEAVAKVWFTISRVGAAWMLRREPRMAEVAGPALTKMAEEGERIQGTEYLDALEHVTALRRRCAEVFSDAELMLTPTVAALPWRAEEPYPTEIDGRPAGPRDHAVFTGWVNVAGLPAVSLPVNVSRAGLPIGVQVVAGFGYDVGLLDFAAGFETRWEAPPLPEL